MARTTRAARTPTAPKLIRQNLREDIALVPGSRVDAAAGIIFGVKIVGRDSPNRHGIAGVDGTEYTPEALRRAIPLYEGRAVNKNHPPKTNPDLVRDVAEPFGWLTNVIEQDGELYGDLHLLLSDPDTPRLLEAAEKHPELFALSHNARGDGEVRNGKYVVTEIVEVRSVDVVTRGGTNRSLFESREGTRPMKKTLRQILEAADKDVKARFKKLLEDDSYGDMQMEAPAEDAAPEAGMDHKQHLGELLKAIVNDPDLSEEEMCAKVKKALGVLGAGDEEEAPVEESEEEEKETPEEEPEKKDKLESREREELTRLREEKKARVLCESLEFTPTSTQLEALVGLPTEQKRKAFIKELAAIKPAVNGKAPRTAVAGGRHLQESYDASKPLKDRLAHYRN